MGFLAGLCGTVEVLLSSPHLYIKLQVSDQLGDVLLAAVLLGISEATPRKKGLVARQVRCT